MLQKQACMKHFWKNSDYFAYHMTFYLDKNCFGFKNKVFLEKEDNKTVEIGNEIPNENEVMKTDEISQGAAKDVTNQSLEMLECSSLKMS